MGVVQKGSVDKSSYKRNVAIAVVLTVIIIMPLAYYYAKVSPKSSTPAFEHPITEASYIIFKDGSTYYARNEETGAIVYSGSDATTIVHSAQDALVNFGGGKILLTRGEYYINLRLKNNIILEGEGHETILKADRNDYSIIENYGRAADTSNVNIHINNLLIDGTEQTGTYVYGIWFKYVTNATIQNVYMKNTHWENIYLWLCNYVVVTQCYITTSGREGISIHESIGCEVSDNIVKDNAWAGISIASSKQTLCSNNSMSNDKQGIYIGSITEGWDCEQNTIVGGAIRNSTGDGILINKTAVADLHHNTIFGIKIVDSGLSKDPDFGINGITMKNGSANQILNAIVSRSRGHGISVSNGSYLILSNVVVIDSSLMSAGTYNGIQLEDASYSFVYGTSYDTRYGRNKTQAYGVASSGSSDHNTIIGMFVGNRDGELFLVGNDNLYIKRDHLFMDFGMIETSNVKVDEKGTNIAITKESPDFASKRVLEHLAEHRARKNCY